MDHNLEDSLNLESAMGVDFEHSEDTVVNQDDISLDATGHEEGLPMEFEHIEEQPMLMDTGSEEIIVSDFMGEQFTLQEYSVHDDQMTGATTTVEANQQQQLTAEGMLDLQFDGQPISVPASGVITQDVQVQPKYITVKAAAPTVRPIAPKKETVVLTKSIAPRQVAIAPKPQKLIHGTIQKINPTSFSTGKQYAIAPKPVKPVTLMANRHTLSLVKKVSVAGNQETPKGNTVIAKLGKQLVMVPSSTAQKLKLMTSGAGVPSLRLLSSADSDQAQLIGPHVAGSQQKQIMTKVVVQGSSADPSNQPAVITKLLPAGSTANPQTRFVTMHQKTIGTVPKTVPISIGNNKVLMGSPSKAGVKFTKKQVITIKSPTQKLTQATLGQGTATKKVVITANPTQNVILKTTAPSKGGHVTKTVGQRTQLHQINVPGKGIQYIKLVTNPTVQTKAQTGTTTPKTFVLTDSKGNLIRMTAEKMGSQPPPLLVTGSLSAGNKVVTSKPPQKLVRIAPVTSKSGQAAMQNRGGQSLLAPLSPPTVPEEQTSLVSDMSSLLEGDDTTTDAGQLVDKYEEVVEEEEPERGEHEEMDSKAALQALIADAVGSDSESQDASRDFRDQPPPHSDHDFSKRQSSECDDSNSMEQPESQNVDHPVIVIPSYMKHQDLIITDDHSNYDDPRRKDGMINVEIGSYNSFQSPDNPQVLVDTDLVSTELGLRPRKPCNCTKSQCLKLYCDCFANGEFCNRCNCTNCHNNLENEELRQKAIRGCLDRNPNAFRPKIGKSKTVGPDVIRRHNKGCNCKRSGCLKNYCECYEAKIACTSICKCVGCRNVEETLERARRRDRERELLPPRREPPPHATANTKQPCSFMTTEVIEAVCQCLVAAAVESEAEPAAGDAVRGVIDEFARCLQDIISASHQAAPLALLDETQA